MSRLFGAYVMVDWSASSKPTTGADSIWIGVAKRNVRFQLAYETHNPPTRAEAEKLIEKLLADFAKRGDRVLVGFDFPLGFPRGTAEALKFEGPAWAAMLRFVSQEIKDKPDNTNNRFQVAAKINRLMTGGPFPFWGAPAKDVQTTLAAKRQRDHDEGEVPEFRHADLAAKGASPIWKLYYQGSVGGQALTGMPLAQRLKDARGERARIWPFETGWTTLTPANLEGVELVIAEIYPSLLKPAVAAGEVKDEKQVTAAAAFFAGLDEKGQLGKAFGPGKSQEALIEAVTGEEGWILGA
jgi:hypothetical protein